MEAKFARLDRRWMRATRPLKTPPGPTLPDDIINRSRDRYLDAYKRLTGQDL